jgi:hypothetical protein
MIKINIIIGKPSIEAFCAAFNTLMTAEITEATLQSLHIINVEVDTAQQQVFIDELIASIVEDSTTKKRNSQDINRQSREELAQSENRLKELTQLYSYIRDLIPLLNEIRTKLHGRRFEVFTCVINDFVKNGENLVINANGSLKLECIIDPDINTANPDINTADPTAALVADPVADPAAAAAAALKAEQIFGYLQNHFKAGHYAIGGMEASSECFNKMESIQGVNPEPGLELVYPGTGEPKDILKEISDASFLDLTTVNLNPLMEYYLDLRSGLKNKNALTDTKFINMFDVFCSLI